MYSVYWTLFCLWIFVQGTSVSITASTGCDTYHGKRIFTQNVCGRSTTIHRTTSPAPTTTKTAVTTEGAILGKSCVNFSSSQECKMIPSNLARVYDIPSIGESFVMLQGDNLGTLFNVLDLGTISDFIEIFMDGLSSLLPSGVKMGLVYTSSQYGIRVDSDIMLQSTTMPILPQLPPAFTIPNGLSVAILF
eukprot:m.351031 g.351031  ORF g.351031 m.351031 type:complete len:191 (+) comp50712_c0_seq1:127-699(+)